MVNSYFDWSLGLVFIATVKCIVSDELKSDMSCAVISYFYSFSDILSSVYHVQWIVFYISFPIY